MDDQGIDALIVLSLENYRYFTGDLRKQPRMLIPREGDPLVLVFEGEKEEAEEKTGMEIKTYRAMHEMMGIIIKFFNSLGVETPKVGIEMEFSTPAFLIDRFRIANPHVEVVDAKPVISPLRKIKDQYELHLMKKAAKLADTAMEKAVDMLKPGITEREVAIEVEYVIRKKGAERLAFPMFVNSGGRSQWLHGMATEKRIEEGDLVLIDIGPVYEGYCADIARTVVIGKATEEQKKIHGLYLEMQEKIIEMIEPGITILDIDRHNEKFMKKHGMKELYVKGFLHGIGLNFEETPFPTIFPEDQMEEVEKGMVLAAGHSVLAVKGTGGVRVEDTLFVGDEVEQFTSFPKELMEVG
jgi:Xaa-Pro aminopeptidase